MDYYEITKKRKLRKRIKEICPDVLTIKETFKDNQSEIYLICRELNCTEDDLLLTPKQFNYLNSYIYR